MGIFTYTKYKIIFKSNIFIRISSNLQYLNIYIYRKKKGYLMYKFNLVIFQIRQKSLDYL